jgi:hypothetical protein
MSNTACPPFLHCRWFANMIRKRQLFSTMVSHKTLPKMKQIGCCLVFYRDFPWPILACGLSDFDTTHFPQGRAAGAAQQILPPSDYCHHLNNSPRIATLNVPVPTSCPLVCSYHPHFQRWYQSGFLPAHISPSCSTRSVAR